MSLRPAWANSENLYQKRKRKKGIKGRRRKKGKEREGDRERGVGNNRVGDL
jgi:hypothetical protein